MTSATPTSNPADTSTPSPDWYKTAVIYELSVRAFYDSNADGIGDFRGLTMKLDYLMQLGVNCLWLLPFSPSPMRDGGYDVMDYTGIHPDFGTMQDFRRFIRAAHVRGIKVITEMVVNHTSDQHPWFQAARRAPRGSAVRNMYVWSDDDGRYGDARIIFTDTERSNWTWDPVAGQYYWHRFFSHQPDLNFESPRVRRAVLNVMKFWFEAGVDGLRLDAIPYLIERDGTNCENLDETHEVIREWRQFVDEHYPDCILLAEANQWPADVRAYFGDGDECHMAFNFPLMPRMFMSLRQEDRHPLVDILHQIPPIPENCQWGLFLRNHDELTLEMVTDEERDYMYTAYAADQKMRLNVGIRRRLSPLLDNNRRAMEMLHSLLFSLPGTPVLYYGDEIGMGDNWHLGDRDGVRTPMQWTSDRNAGFSQADPARLYGPVIMDPLYGYQAVNVEAQERSASSLLNWMRRMIALRRKRPVFGLGDMEVLHPANRSVFAFIRRYGDEVILVVANLSRFVQPVSLDLAEYAGTVPTEVIGGNAFPPITEQPYFLSLAPHAFYWFDLIAAPTGVEAPLPDLDQVPAISVSGDWDRLFASAARDALEGTALPAFIRGQRWFGEKDRDLQTVRLGDPVQLTDTGGPTWATQVTCDVGGGDVTTYTLPLAVAVGRAAQRIRESSARAVLARIEGPRGRGVLYDATASDAFVLRLLELARRGETVTARAGNLRGEAGRAMRELYDSLDESPTVTRSSTEQSNTSVQIGGQLLLKLFRRVEPGPHPEIEVARHFERIGFTGSPRFAGAITAETAAGASAFAVLHELVWNQADGWTYALGEVVRYLEEAPELHGTIGEPSASHAVRFEEAARTLGMRTAEMHAALADARGDAAFEPEPMGPQDVTRLLDRIQERMRLLTSFLREARNTSPDAARILERARGLRGRLRARLRAQPDVWKIRCHGDYHLGQVLWAREDFTIIDFEGEVGLPLEARRQKTSALVDVAGMLRSFGYAAAVGLREAVERQSQPGVTTEDLRVIADQWRDAAERGFLDGYARAQGNAVPLVPAGPTFASWLAAYQLDKALHEIEYEIGHRPDWVDVPLAAAAALLGRLTGDAT